MTNVLEVISQEAQWLKQSRDELLAQLRRANRVANRRWGGQRRQWRSLVAELSTLVDRSVGPMFDAALAVTEFAQDMRASYRRILRRR
jgi:hypothetical protein